MARAAKRKLMARGSSSTFESGAKGIETRRRIVLCAIALFNRHGVPNVSFERIAESLNISPGNLTYYFKRKNVLMRATLRELKERLAVALQPPVDVDSAQDGVVYMVRLYRELWNFRFFFNSLAYLLTDDKRLREEYVIFEQWVIGTHVAVIQYLAKRGYMARESLPRAESTLLAECVWAQVLHWLRMQQIVSPIAATPPDDAIYQLGMRVWCLWNLQLKPDWAKEMRRGFEAFRHTKTSAGRLRPHEQNAIGKRRSNNS